MKKMKLPCNCVPMGKKLTIAIDIDGTVADSSLVDMHRTIKDPEEFMKSKPIKGALEAVKKLYKAGHVIVFHSSRGYGNRAVTSKWLKKHGFPFHHIELNKFVAHVYIDDRAINGCDWKYVMEDIKKPVLPGRIARRKGML